MKLVMKCLIMNVVAVTAGVCCTAVDAAVLVV